MGTKKSGKGRRKVGRKKPSSMKVKIPMGTIGIRGTDFSLQIDSDGQKLLLNEISEDHILVVKDQFGTVRFLNQLGTMVTIQEGRPLSDVIFASPEQIEEMLSDTPVVSEVEDEDEE